MKQCIFVTGHANDPAPFADIAFADIVCVDLEVDINCGGINWLKAWKDVVLDLRVALKAENIVVTQFKPLPQTLGDTKL